MLKREFDVDVIASTIGKLRGAKDKIEYLESLLVKLESDHSKTKSFLNKKKSKLDQLKEKVDYLENQNLRNFLISQIVILDNKAHRG
ncbi:MAG: hypothetical protein HXY49_02120 [Ignavibacteriaceae bacterium]|nr:hypothetical protein [Ignavibacteriaceae bacterium]